MGVLEGFLLVGTLYVVWEMMSGEAPSDVERRDNKAMREVEVRRGIIPSVHDLFVRIRALNGRGIPVPPRPDNGTDPARWVAQIDQTLANTRGLAPVFESPS